MKYFSALSDKLERWTDTWNPVLVRELRIAIRNGIFRVWGIAFLLLFSSLFIFFYHSPPDTTDLPEEVSRFDLVGFFLVCVTGHFIAFASLLPCFRLIRVISQTEMLDSTAMPSRKIFHGYILLGLVPSGLVSFYTVIALFLWGILTGGGIFLPVVYLLLLNAGCCVVNLVALSVFAKAKTFAQQCLVFFGHYLAIYPSVGILALIAHLLTPWITTPLDKLDDFYTIVLIVVIEILLFLILFGTTAYRLALYHFEHPHETLYSLMGRNILIYNCVFIFAVLLCYLAVVLFSVI